MPRCRDQPPLRQQSESARRAFDTGRPVATPGPWPARRASEMGHLAHAKPMAGAPGVGDGATRRTPSPWPARRASVPPRLRSRAGAVVAFHGAGVTTMAGGRGFVACANTSSEPARPPDTPDVRGGVPGRNIRNPEPGTRTRTRSRTRTQASQTAGSFCRRIFTGRPAATCIGDVSWLRGGAGSIRGCHRHCAQTTVFTQRSQCAGSRRPRADPENHRGHLTAMPTEVAG